MSATEILRSAVRNTFRSKLRTALTVVAIVIGAFTLTITSAIGAGVSSYIDGQLGAIGAEGVVTVMQTPEDQFGADTGPALYDPERAQTGLPGGGGPGLAFEPLTASQIDTIAGTAGVDRVEPVVLVSADFVEAPGSERFELALNPMSAATVPDLAAGRAVDGSADNEIVLQDTYVEPLGFATADDALGTVVTIGVSDALGGRHEVPATVVGVQNATLFDIGASINPSLTDALAAAQATGRPADLPVGYLAAIAHLADADQVTVDRVKDDLAAEGLTAQTTADQIGQFQTVISGIVGVLNAFAVIALVAAGFGIVNTLLMSVQERTREIGLMKAMGMGSGRVFALFSTEAVVIGFLGSAIGAGVAAVLGTAISSALAETALSGLPGLQIMLFEPLSIAVVVLVVMAIAFVAGTLPARRAAVQNPIDALRYE